MLISSSSKRGKCIRVRRRRRSVVMGLDIEVAMGTAYFRLGADNTTSQRAFESNLCTGPQDCIFEDRLRSHPAILANCRAAKQLGARINLRAPGDALRPARHFHVTGPPALIRNLSVDLEILSSRTNVEPLPVIKNHAANL